MKRTGFALFALSLAGGIVCAGARGESAVSARTEAVALFKNGYAVVWREIEIPESGVYRWEDVPAVIHGTFFVESDMEVEVLATQRDVAVPVGARNPPRLAPGQMVNVHCSDGYITGRIVETTPAAEPNSLLPGLRSASRSFYDDYYWQPNNQRDTAASDATVVLEMPEDKTLRFISGRNIWMVETHAPVGELTLRRPVMIFKAKKEGGGGGKIRVVYLTKGATWAPSYRVDVLDGKRLRIEQATVVRNEGAPIAGAEVSLVSGFPNIGSANVLSPITPSQTLAAFFQQVISQERKNRSGRDDDESYLMQQVSMLNYAHFETGDAGFDTSAFAEGEGPDIYYNSIGRRTLDVGDTLSLTVGRGEADYRRVLECDLYPQILKNYNANNSRSVSQVLTPDVFDVLKFQNPLPFPMTTAPVMVMDNSRFLGQSQTAWVNPQQVASVKITKVMNVSASYTEQVTDVVPRETQEFRSSRHVKRDVAGTFDIVNRRNERITLHLKSGFLGVISETDAEPANRRVVPVDFWPNDMHELLWELTLEPGETKTITINGWRWVRG